mgnify:CR=1 FL=1
MGTMEKIRSTSPYFLAAFAIIFVGFMVASDADISTLLRQGQNYETAVLAKINGEPIYYKDYEKRVEEELEKERAQVQEGEEVDDDRVRKQVWNQLVEDILMGQEAKKAGIEVTAEEIRDVMLENPPRQLADLFTDSTGFNKQAYQMYVTHPEQIKFPDDWTQEQKDEQLSNWRQTVMTIEGQLREQKLRQAISLLAGTSSAIMPNDFAKNQYVIDNSTANVNLIFVNSQEIPDEQVTVSDKEVKDYYERYKHLFIDKDMRRVRYVIFEIKPSKGDSIRAEKKIELVNSSLMSVDTPEAKDSVFDVRVSELGGETVDYTLVSDVDPKLKQYLLELNKLEITGPITIGDSKFFLRLDDKRSGENTQVKASHILIEFGENKEASKEEAIRIMNLAKSGLPFDSLAQVYSKDPGSGSKGGDLGYFTKGKMVKEFEDAAFATDSGGITGPVETKYGWHIIKVTDKISDELKWSQIEIKVNISTPTRNQIFRDAHAFHKQIQDGGDFTQIAEKLKLNPIETPFFTNQRPILNSQYITDIAFQNKPGFLLEPLELKYQGIVVVQVAEERSKGTTPFADKAEEIKKRLVLKKKVDLVKSRAQNIYNKVANYGSLKAAAAADSMLKVISDTSFRMASSPSGVRRDVLFNQAVFSKTTPLMKILPPIKGENGWYIVEIKERKQSDPAKLTKEEMISYKKSMQNNQLQRAFYDWFRSVRENAEIDDKRSNYYKSY